MDVIVLQAFVGLVLVAGAVLLFLFSARQGDLDAADRIALFPIEDSEEERR